AGAAMLATLSARALARGFQRDAAPASNVGAAGGGTAGVPPSGGPGGAGVPPAPPVAPSESSATGGAGAASPAASVPPAPARGAGGAAQVDPVAVMLGVVEPDGAATPRADGAAYPAAAMGVPLVSEGSLTYQPPQAPTRPGHPFDEGKDNG